MTQVFRLTLIYKAQKDCLLLKDIAHVIGSILIYKTQKDCLLLKLREPAEHHNIASVRTNKLEKSLETKT